MALTEDFLQTLAALGLLDRLWPSERVWEGILVCKWLSRFLPGSVEKVVLHDTRWLSEKRLLSFKEDAKFHVILRKLPQHATLLSLQCLHNTSRQGFGHGLVHLDLGESVLGSEEGDFPNEDQPEQMQHLCALLMNCSQISCLKLDETGVGDESLNSLSVSLGKCTKLSHLDLRGNAISNSGATLLANALSSCAALSCLRLGFNEFGWFGGEALCGAIHHCNALTRLELNCNLIQREGVNALSEVIPQLPLLQYLDASGLSTDLAASAVYGLAKSFLHCPKLCHLDLGNNSFGDLGAEVLAEFLPSYPSLRHLELNLNGMGEEGVGKLARVLPSCRNLRHLDLRGNSIGPGPDALLALASVANKCAALECVDVSGHVFRGDATACLCFFPPQVRVQVD